MVFCKIEFHQKNKVMMSGIDHFFRFPKRENLIGFLCGSVKLEPHHRASLYPQSYDSYTGTCLY